MVLLSGGAVGGLPGLARYTVPLALPVGDGTLHSLLSSGARCRVPLYFRRLHGTWVEGECLFAMVLEQSMSHLQRTHGVQHASSDEAAHRFKRDCMQRALIQCHSTVKREFESSVKRGLVVLCDDTVHIF